MRNLIHTHIYIYVYILFTDGSYTKGTRAHTHRELTREWLWEPKGSSLEYFSYYVSLLEDADDKTQMRNLSAIYTYTHI